MATGGNYRWRTRLRRHLPDQLTWLAPKGQHDCGDHEWYRESERAWRCFHCEIGAYEGETPPWSPEDTVVKSALALRGLIETAHRRDLREDEHRLMFDLVRSLVEALEGMGLVRTEGAPDPFGALQEEHAEAYDSMLQVLQRVYAGTSEPTGTHDPSRA